MSDPPYPNKEKGSYVIVLEDGGHRIKVNHYRDKWELKIDHIDGPTSRETSWATIKTPEGLRNSPNAKRLREAIQYIFGGNTTRIIDDIIGIMQTQPHLWPIPEQDLSDAPSSKEPTQAEKLVELILTGDTRFFRDQYDDEYAVFNLQDFLSDASAASDAFSICDWMARDTDTLSVCQEGGGVVKTATPATLATPPKRRYYRMKSNKVKDILALIMYKKSGEVPGGDAIRSTIMLLSGYTMNKPRIKLANRLASTPDGGWWLDLSNEAGEAIYITDQGWQLVAEPPILFKRYSHQLPLRHPAQSGEVLDILGFSNFASLDEQLLYMVFGVLEVLVPDIPHVIPYIYGEKGTVKSTSQVAVKAIFDNSIMTKGLLNMHRDSNKLGQVLDHHYLAYFDNISHIDEDQSDLLCRAVTGAGISNRLLYSDDDDFIRQFMRCVGLNGINIAAYKPDLLDRCVLLNTQKVLNSTRKEDKVIMGEVYAKAAGILGGALDIIVKARQNMAKGIDVAGGLSRMADAMKWGVAITEALGIEGDKFLVAYQNNRLYQEENSVKSSVVGDLLIQLLDRKLPAWKNEISGWKEPDIKEFKSTPSDLFIELKAMGDKAGLNTRTDFPPDSTRLSMEINEFAPNLPACGFRLIRKRSGEDGRKIIFTRLIPTKLDESMDIQRVENNWGDAKDLREYIKNKRGVTPPASMAEVVKSAELVEDEKKAAPNLLEITQQVIGDLAVMDWSEAIKDEVIISAIMDKHTLTTIHAVKIISILMRDGIIFNPRPGFYKFSGGA